MLAISILRILRIALIETRILSQDMSAGNVTWISANAALLIPQGMSVGFDCKNL
jgi:hypothetical protein